jgi:hypothetical protein
VLPGYQYDWSIDDLVSIYVIGIFLVSVHCLVLMVSSQVLPLTLFEYRPRLKKTVTGRVFRRTG